MYKNIKAIIFDFDGVLCDTFDFHKNKISEISGHQLEESELKDIHKGNIFCSSLEKIKGIDWEEYRNFIYREQVEFVIDKKTINVIKKLSSKYKLYIISSGGEKNIKDCFKKNKIIHYFGDVFGFESDKLKVKKFKLLLKKYSFKKDECLFVTDTLGDIKEANRVGIKTIAVDFGYHNKKTLCKGNPIEIISNIEKLLLIINNK